MKDETENPISIPYSAERNSGIQRGHLTGLTAFVAVARSVSMTDSGRRLLERLRPAIDQIADALDNLDQERPRVSGRRLRTDATSHLVATTVIARYGNASYRPTRMFASSSM
jgi:hypothetical protein